MNNEIDEYRTKARDAQTLKRLNELLKEVSMKQTACESVIDEYSFSTIKHFLLGRIFQMQEGYRKIG